LIELRFYVPPVTK